VKNSGRKTISGNAHQYESGMPLKSWRMKQRHEKLESIEIGILSQKIKVTTLCRAPLRSIFVQLNNTTKTSLFEHQRKGYFRRTGI
jgi:hypothetical protein